MYNCYFDSGTSNTRLYLLKDDLLVDTHKTAIGSKDVSIRGDNSVLLAGLKEMYDQMLWRNSLTDRDVEGVYASGMVTCPYGICEVPHMVVPVDAAKMFREIYVHYEDKYFRRQLKLIRGVKTMAQTAEMDMKTIGCINNIRGEEIEVLGVIAEYLSITPEEDCAIFLPGSHTHICYVKNQSILDCLSTFTGELRHALQSATVLSGSLTTAKKDGALDNLMVLEGYKALQANGIARSLYMVHASRIFNIADNDSRNSYLTGIIAGSAVEAFSKKLEQDWRKIKTVIVAGTHNYISAYKMILDYLLPALTTVIIHPAGDIGFSARGFIEMIKQSTCKEGIVKCRKF